MSTRKGCRRAKVGGRMGPTPCGARDHGLCFFGASGVCGCFFFVASVVDPVSDKARDKDCFRSRAIPNRKSPANTGSAAFLDRRILTQKTGRLCGGNQFPYQRMYIPVSEDAGHPTPDAGWRSLASLSSFPSVKSLSVCSVRCQHVLRSALREAGSLRSLLPVRQPVARIARCSVV